MVTFDSTVVSNIFLASIALTNIVIMAILYERFSKKRVLIIKRKDKKEADEHT